MKQRGFTLIELFVIVAIVAILSAILCPIVAREREMAGGPICMSNLKQMGSSMLMYIQEYNQEFPPARYPAPSGESSSYDGTVRSVYWISLIYPYANDKAVFTCPTVATGNYAGAPTVSMGTVTHETLLRPWVSTKGTPWVNMDDAAGNSFGDPSKAGQAADRVSFYYDEFVGNKWALRADGTWDDIGGKGGVNASDVLNPAGKFMFWDTSNPFDLMYTDVNSGERNWCVAARHNGGANFCYIDGHVGWLAVSSLTLPQHGVTPPDYPSSSTGEWTAGTALLDHRFIPYEQ